MGGLFALQAEILRRPHQPLAKGPLPNLVPQHAGNQRMPTTCQVASVSQATTGGWKPGGIDRYRKTLVVQDTQFTRSHLAAGLVEITTRKQVRDRHLARDLG